MRGTQSEDDVSTFVAARWAVLVRFGVLLTGDRGHAEDLVQSALEKCWPRWSQIGDAAHERYVKAAMANLASSRWRRRRFREVPLGPPHDARLSGAGPADQQASRDELWRLLQGLTPRMRAVVVLRYAEDLSEAETARLLGCSVGTVKSQSSRALARLREALNANQDDVTGVRS